MTLREVAALLGGELAGPAELEIKGLGAVDSAVAGELVVAFDADALATAEGSSAAAIVVGPAVRPERPHIRVDNPRAAFDQLLDAFAPPPRPPAGIHPSAVIDPTVVLGAEPTVGPGTVIEADVVIGDRCRIGAQCFVGERARLGDDVTLHPRVTLYAGVVLGDRVVVHSGAVIGADGFGYRQTPQGHRKVPHLGTVVLEDDVEIGANSCIDRAKVGATRIGAGTKIDNLVLIAHNCRLGRHCLLVGQSGLAGSVVLGDGVVLAGQAGVADHLTIGDGAVVGAQAGVMRAVEPGGRVIGTPASDPVQFFRQLALLRRLPELLQRLRRLERVENGPEDAADE